MKKFNNLPSEKKLEKEPSIEQKEEVNKPKRAKRKSLITWKVKGIALLIVIGLIAYGTLKTVEAISGWFDNNKMVFHEVVKVEVNPPFTIEPRIISPIQDVQSTPSAMLQVLVPEVQAEELPPVINGTIKGTASYYSTDGCLGCNSALIMANGEKLKDEAYTLAMTPEMVKKHKLLNDMVKITNTLTKKTVIAKVTDTGGFAKYNRIADLSVATKEALGCGHLCEVEIVF